MVAAPVAVYYKVTSLDPTATVGDWWKTPLEHPLPCGFVTLPSSCSFETAATTDAVLTALITIWMENYVSEGKLKIISRDDCLLYIIKRSSGMTGASRDIGELSTKKKTRSDMTMVYTNVPLVIVEEEWEDIRYASDDLKKTFQWLPHHNDLPFVFGLALTKSEFQIYLMTADAGWKLRKPIVSANIDLTDDRTECLLYAVNIARVIT